MSQALTKMYPHIWQEACVTSSQLYQMGSVIERLDKNALFHGGALNIHETE